MVASWNFRVNEAMNALSKGDSIAAAREGEAFGLSASVTVNDGARTPDSFSAESFTMWLSPMILRASSTTLSVWFDALAKSAGKVTVSLMFTSWCLLGEYSSESCFDKLHYGTGSLSSKVRMTSSEVMPSASAS